jgi:hypothetical protein
MEMARYQQNAFFIKHIGLRKSLLLPNSQLFDEPSPQPRSELCRLEMMMMM